MLTSVVYYCYALEAVGKASDMADLQEAIRKFIVVSNATKQNIAILNRRILECGLTIRSKVKGDGNCFFRAIFDQLHRLAASPKSHKEVRRTIVGYLSSYPFTVR